jgi:hypothetical protein
MGERRKRSSPSWPLSATSDQHPLGLQQLLRDLLVEGVILAQQDVRALQHVRRLRPLGRRAGGGEAGTLSTSISTVKTEPFPGSLFTLMVPPMTSTIRLAMASPSPEPRLSEVSLRPS